jgi:hypothetical protein
LWNFLKNDLIKILGLGLVFFGIGWGCCVWVNTGRAGIPSEIAGQLSDGYREIEQQNIRLRNQLNGIRKANQEARGNLEGIRNAGAEIADLNREFARFLELGE